MKNILKSLFCRKSKYIYFVSYFCTSQDGTLIGMGNIDMTSPYKYTTIDHIREIEAVLAKDFNINKAIVINYRLLRSETNNNYVL